MDFNSEDFVRRTITDQPLGAFWQPEATVFRLWAPEATEVGVRLYSGYEGAFAADEHSMERGPQGVWSARVSGDHDGKYYTYVTHYEGRGTMEGVDPYARAVGPQGQRGFLFDPQRAVPPHWADDRPPPLKSILESSIYELHVRDASSLASSGAEHRGQFLALTETGTLSPGGHPTVLDHIASLGFTHVHLLPVFDFDGVDDLEFSPSDYNWGYNPRNFNALKLAYCSNPRDPVQAILEFKKVVQAFHQRGIRVVLDMVYNHTFASVDSHLNRAYPFFYYRMHGPHWSNGSGCGNELATERPMVRRYILDSLRYWKEEFHLDGFRFDLVGLYDLQTMNQVVQEFQSADPTFLLYGEGWTGGLSTLPDEQKTIKSNAAKVPGLAFFSDENRDALKGHVFEVERKGFVNGGDSKEWETKFAVAGCTAHPSLGRGTWARGPEQVINYVSAHDNHTLYDKLAHTNPHHSEKDRIAMARLAHALVFLSQGIPFFMAGEEFLRTKKGVENSYNSPDDINGLDWAALDRHQATVDYIKGLLALRRKYSMFRLPDAQTISSSLQFPELLEAHMLAWTLGTDLYAVANAHARSREVHLPRGEWQLLADHTGAGLEARGAARNGMIVVEGRSLVLLVRTSP